MTLIRELNLLCTQITPFLSVCLHSTTLVGGGAEVEGPRLEPCVNQSFPSGQWPYHLIRSVISLQVVGVEGLKVLSELFLFPIIVPSPPFQH